MIIDYSVKSPNLDNIYYGLGFFTTWNSREAIAVITFLGKAVVIDSQVYGSVLLDEQVEGAVSLDSQIGTAVVVDKTDE